jgi:hypothetical protein
MMTAPAIQTLAEVLQQAEQVPWDHTLYLDPQRPWHANTRCVLLDPDDVEDPETDDEPVFAQQHGFRYALTMRDIQGIVENAREQRAGVPIPDLIQAFSCICSMIQGRSAGWQRRWSISRASAILPLSVLS